MTPSVVDSVPANSEAADLATINAARAAAGLKLLLPSRGSQDLPPLPDMTPEARTRLRTAFQR